MDVEEIEVEEVDVEVVSAEGEQGEVVYLIAAGAGVEVDIVQL